MSNSKAHSYIKCAPSSPPDRGERYINVERYERTTTLFGLEAIVGPIDQKDGTECHFMGHGALYLKRENIRWWEFCFFSPQHYDIIITLITHKRCKKLWLFNNTSPERKSEFGMRYMMFYIVTIFQGKKRKKITIDIPISCRCWCPLFCIYF